MIIPHGLSAIFHLGHILDNDKDTIINSKELFPNILRKNKQSNLMVNLNNLNYDFKWVVIILLIVQNLI